MRLAAESLYLRAFVLSNNKVLSVYLSSFWSWCWSVCLYLTSSFFLSLFSPSCSYLVLYLFLFLFPSWFSSLSPSAFVDGCYSTQTMYFLQLEQFSGQNAYSLCGLFFKQKQKGIIYIIYIYIYILNPLRQRKATFIQHSDTPLYL